MLLAKWHLRNHLATRDAVEKGTLARDRACCTTEQSWRRQQWQQQLEGGTPTALGFLSWNHASTFCRSQTRQRRQLSAESLHKTALKPLLRISSLQAKELFMIFSTGVEYLCEVNHLINFPFFSRINLDQLTKVSVSQWGKAGKCIYFKVLKEKEKKNIKCHNADETSGEKNALFLLTEQPIMEKLLVFIVAPLTKSLLHYLVLIGKNGQKNAFISVAVLGSGSVLLFRRTSSSCKWCRTRLGFFFFLIARVRRIGT